MLKSVFENVINCPDQLKRLPLTFAHRKEEFMVNKHQICVWEIFTCVDNSQL